MPLPKRKAKSRAFLLSRLKSECRVHGRAVEIARATGVSPEHISRVRSGKAQLGDLFAQSLIDLWKLDKDAPETAGRPTAPPYMPPNLRDALAFCRDDYPARFLEHASELGTRHTVDRRRPEWVIWIETQYWDWKEEGRRKRAPAAPEKSGTFSWANKGETNVRSRRRRAG